VRAYRIVSLGLAAAFAITGAVFLFFPGAVLSLFDALSGPLGMPPSPGVGSHFYLILTGGYMYLVALLAWLMFRRPQNNDFPFLLANGKLATALISLAFFFFHQPLLIYLGNSIVDGLIGVVVLVFYRVRRAKLR
jgi:hypothetical protein